MISAYTYLDSYLILNEVVELPECCKFTIRKLYSNTVAYVCMYAHAATIM